METIMAHRLLGCLLALCVDGISAAQEEGAETEIDFVTTTSFEDHNQRSRPGALDFSKGSLCLSSGNGTTVKLNLFH